MKVALQTFKLTNWKMTYRGDDLQLINVTVTTCHQAGSPKCSWQLNPFLIHSYLLSSFLYWKVVTFNHDFALSLSRSIPFKGWLWCCHKTSHQQVWIFLYNSWLKIATFLKFSTSYLIFPSPKFFGFDMQLVFWKFPSCLPSSEKALQHFTPKKAAS